MSETGSDPKHCCSPPSWELLWAAGNVSSFGHHSHSDPKVLRLERDAHGPKKPRVSLHTSGIHCQKEPVVFHAKVSFPECPLLPPSPGVPWSGLSAGNFQSAQQEILFGLSALAWGGKGFLCGGCCGLHSSLPNLYHIVRSRAEQSPPGSQSSGGAKWTGGTQLFSCPTLLPWATAGFGCCMEELASLKQALMKNF